jgi:hypothetical protein
MTVVLESCCPLQLTVTNKKIVIKNLIITIDKTANGTSCLYGLAKETLGVLRQIRIKNGTSQPQ